MIETKDAARPSKALVERVKAIGAAAATSTLYKLGVRNAHICGPVSWNRGIAIAGPALTLQFMPKREDIYGMNMPSRRSSFIAMFSITRKKATSSWSMRAAI